MLKKVKKISDKKVATAQPKKVIATKKTASKPKVEKTKPKVEKAKPKSKADLLREKIELKRAEHREAASRGPRAAESYRLELISLEEELSKHL